VLKPLPHLGRRCRECVTLPRGFFAVLVLALYSGLAFPVDRETQTWITANASAPLGEVQRVSMRYRSRYSEVLGDQRLQQYQLMGAYRMSNGVTAAMGIEFFRADSGTVERRLIPELRWGTSLWDLALKHRLRLEHRDLTAFADPVYRLRYQLTHERPLADTGAYLVVGDEILVSLSEETGLLDRGLNQNRLGGGLGYRVTPSTKLELGYQWIYVDSGPIARADHILQLNLNLALP